jgi:hypothetical protein
VCVCVYIYIYICGYAENDKINHQKLFKKSMPFSMVVVAHRMGLGFIPSLEPQPDLRGRTPCMGLGFIIQGWVLVTLTWGLKKKKKLLDLITMKIISGINFH